MYSKLSASSPFACAPPARPLEMDAGGLVADSGGDAGPPIVEASEVIDAPAAGRDATEGPLCCENDEKYPTPGCRCFSESRTPDCSLRNSSRNVCRREGSARIRGRPSGHTHFVGRPQVRLARLYLLETRLELRHALQPVVELFLRCGLRGQSVSYWSGSRRT